MSTNTCRRQEKMIRKSILFSPVLLELFVISLLCGAASATPSCQNPELIPTIYTTQDATVLKHITYIAEFNIKCQSIGASSGNLYALLGDGIVPVASVGPNKYQLSWTEESKSPKTGEVTVKIFDEAGYAAVRKAIRAGGGGGINNVDISSVRHFAQVTVLHKGMFTGPWISCEFLAVVSAVVIVYYALSFRAKLVA